MNNYKVEFTDGSYVYVKATNESEAWRKGAGSSPGSTVARVIYLG
jgi:hypothetical protein